MNTKRGFYMKKFGFTLAEVLITLGVIGVIAAITIPSLHLNTTTAQVGPKLAKAVAMFEQANEKLLNEYQTDALTDTGLIPSATKASEEDKEAKISNSAPTSYANALSNHLKISKYFGTTLSFANNSSDFGDVTIKEDGFSWQANDGTVYYICFNEAGGGAIPHQNHVGKVFIDINGAALPNLVGSDGFAFTLMNDGSLDPIGSNSGYGTPNLKWTEKCANNTTPTVYHACTASIFANGLKVLYKMR
jgi:prepilin-type N-terminal cleavage/methylation domain-containing protein